MSQLVLGLVMVLAPATFFEEVGPYGTRNDHYLRDVSTIYLALGVALLAAVARPSWRLPVLALAALQYGFHAINHAFDVEQADPGWLGPANLVSLLLTGVLIAVLATRSEREA